LRKNLEAMIDIRPPVPVIFRNGRRVRDLKEPDTAHAIATEKRAFGNAPIPRSVELTISAFMHHHFLHDLVSTSCTDLIDRRVHPANMQFVGLGTESLNRQVYRNRNR